MSLIDRPRTWNEVDLFNELYEEFGSHVPPDFLREVAVDEVKGFEFARIRDYIPLIAHRRARHRVMRHLRAPNVVEGDFPSPGSSTPTGSTDRQDAAVS